MMKNMTISTVLLAMLCASAQANPSALLDGGWRISAGPIYDPGTKASLRFIPRAVYVSPFPSGVSKSSARAAAEGAKTSETRTDFSNGSWIDVDDPVYRGGDDYGRTRYYKFYGSPEDGGVFSLGSAEYSEVSTSLGTPSATYADDESGMLGVSVELSRNLYHDAERGWGFDVAFAFNYFRHDGIFSARSSWLNGSSTRRSGVYSSQIDLKSSGDYDEWNWHGEGADRFYGSGGYSGNAGPIDGTSVQLANVESVATDSSYGALDAEGDYENMELILMARPYYDIVDWLRFNAMFGLAVSRQDLDLSMAIMRDGAIDSRSGRDISQWDVYGIAGAGLMLYYRDFTFSVDVFSRFLDSDLDVKEDCVRGSVERGRWMFRLSLGYEF